MLLYMELIGVAQHSLQEAGVVCIIQENGGEEQGVLSESAKVAHLARNRTEWKYRHY